MGDWEADSLRGPQQSDAGLAVFAERKTQYVVVAKTTDRAAATFNRASQRAFRRQAQPPVRTVTSDNGREFGEHQTLRATSVVGCTLPIRIMRGSVAW